MMQFGIQNFRIVLSLIIIGVVALVASGKALLKL